MTTPRYTRLRAAAQTAEIRTATYEGAEHLVVPVIALVGDSVLSPLGSEGPEFVPESVIAMAPASWNGRAAVEDHPLDDDGNPISANAPEILQGQSFGTIFNSRYEDGRLKMDAWINPARAARAGEKAASVVKRLRALADSGEGDPVEVSVGAFVILEQVAGVSPSGEQYSARWAGVIPDHLAVGLGGAKGACSTEAGCGAPRSAAEADPPKRALMRAAILAQARRPTFSGTETSAWSAPTWADCVRYLHEGAEGPGSVGQAPMALKRRIAAHSLLGDPDGTNLRELIMFPVVNPANGNLNERALRAVLGGRGAQADIPERARTSAQDMARRLLNSEFGAELEAAKMSDTEKTKGRAAAESRNLEDWLRDALEAAERGFDYLWVESFDTEAGTVIYHMQFENGPGETWRREFELDEANEEVTVSVERTAVRRKIVYEEAPELTAARRSAGWSLLPEPLVKALAQIGIRAGQDEGTSDVELRERMWKALNGAEPGFVEIAGVFPETNTVIYSTQPDPEERPMWWRRTYATFEESVTLNDDAVQVEIEQTWKPVAAAEKKAKGEQATLKFESAAEGESAPCGCEKGNGPAALSQTVKGGPMKSKDEIVGRLIAHTASPFDDTDKDKAFLQSLSDDKLKALDAAFPEEAAEGSEEGEGSAPAAAAPPKAAEKAETPAEGGDKAKPVAAAAAETADAEHVSLKREEHDRLIKAAASWEATEARRLADEERQKAALIEQLKGKQDAYDEQELKAMSLEALRKTAKLVQVETEEPDYSGRALARASATEADATPPDPYAAMIAAKRAKLGYPAAQSADGKEAN